MDRRLRRGTGFPDRSLPVRQRARESKRTATYGSARWAERGDIEQAGLLGQDGVVLGRWERDYIRHDGPEHVLCFAPTRSGKGVGWSFPRY